MIVDLFAGIGWAIGLRTLGLHEVGFDIDADVCVNRAQLGLSTVRVDVSSWPLNPLRGRVTGLLASPPCVDFSAAGKRAGRAGETGWLVDEPLRWVLELRPEWTAWEQVPEALPVWQAAAPVLRRAGYSVWCGILNSADYGVPQTRRRAILMASRTKPAQPPEPTHAEDPQPTLFGPPLRPWVTMADALGWVFGDTPGRTVCGNRYPRWTPPDPDGTHGRIALRPCACDMVGAVAGRRSAAHRDDCPWHDDSPSVVLRPGIVDGRNRRRYGPDEPAPTVCFGHDAASWVWELHTNRGQEPDGTRQTVAGDRPAPAFTAKAGGQWVFHRPATTVCADPRLGAPGHRDREGGEPQFGVGSVRLTVAEALTLQGFPAGLKLVGSKTAQFRLVGNAVPPPLATAIVAELAGHLF